MLLTSLQTSPLSLFSSTSTNPFALFSVCTNSNLLPEDAGIVLLHDDTNEYSEITQAKSDQFKLKGGNHHHHLHQEGEKIGARLDDIVAHLQSPTIQSTFLQCPPIITNQFSSRNENGLGIRLPHIHFQVCLIGASFTRPFFVEIGVRDQRGTRAKIRCSTFQRKAKVYLPQRLSSSKPIDEDRNEEEEGKRALLHIPIVLPSNDENKATDWLTLSLPLNVLMSHFQDPSLLSQERSVDFVGGGQQFKQTRPIAQFDQVDYVRVHANCRLRRIWFTSHPQTEHSTHFSLPGLKAKSTQS